MHLNPPFAFSTMTKSMLGHQSIYSLSLVLRLYGLNQPGNQIEGDVREAWPLSLSLWRVFLWKWRCHVRRCCLWRHLIVLLLSCGAKDASTVLQCCCAVDVQTVVNVQVVLWRSVHCKKSWRSSSTPASGDAGPIHTGVEKSFRHPWRKFYCKYQTYCLRMPNFFDRAWIFQKQHCLGSNL
jgi:hypothetical protein